LLLDKQIELIGPANMKSKESQATIKTLEGQLAAYFSSTKEIPSTASISDFSFPVKSHQKIVKFEEDYAANCIVHRVDALNLSVDQVAEQLKSFLCMKRKRKVFAWLENSEQPTSTESPIEFTTAEENPPVDQISENIPVTKENLNPKLWNEYSNGVVKVTEPVLILTMHFSLLIM
jgi:hypothetical protein